MAVAASPPPPAPMASPLTPLAITTQQLGAQWASLGTERKIQMATTIGSCPDLMAAMQRHLNIHAVEIIGSEGIAAGQSATGMPCFIHGDLGPGRLGLIVKTGDAALAAAVVELCQQVLK